MRQTKPPDWLIWALIWGINLLIIGYIIYAATRPLPKPNGFDLPERKVVIMQNSFLLPISPPYLMRGKIYGISMPDIEIIRVLGYRTVTAYTSSPEETDDTPFITASGQRVRPGIAASNELEFGTKFILEGGTRIYEVQDRTHSRYKYLIDLWMPTKKEAKEFGRQVRKVLIVEER